MTVREPPVIPEEIEYPDSDGKPMGESELHIDWMVALLEMLRQHLRGQGIHVGANMFFYYERGNPRRSFAPDLYAIRNCDPDRRFRVIKIWEDGHLPCFVLETTSAETRREDTGRKRTLYRRLGIAEYFLFDPTAEWLDPPLQGYRLTGARYVRVRPEDDGSLLSRELNLRFRLDDAGGLAVFDSATGRQLRTGYDLFLLEQRRAEDERRRAAAAEDEARRLRERLAAAEAELARLQGRPREERE